MQFVRDQLIEPGMTVIECGAHHGAQTILLSRWVGVSGKVIAIEPIPENVAILQKNIEINELTNVVVMTKAAGPSSGHISMKSRSNGAVSSTSNIGTIQIDCITLDEISSETETQPGLIKMDVEGYEYQILKGAKSLLARSPAIFLEVHTLTLPRYGNVFDDLWSLVDAERYDLFIQDNDLKRPVKYTGGDPGGRVHLFFKPLSARGSIAN